MHTKLHSKTEASGDLALTKTELMPQNKAMKVKHYAQIVMYKTISPKKNEEIAIVLCFLVTTHE